MAYWIDRSRAFLAGDVVAALSMRWRGARMRVLLHDGSLYDTRTRPQTFVQAVTRGMTRDEGMVWPSEQQTLRG